MPKGEREMEITRYFTMTTYTEPYALFRMVTDDEAKTMTTEGWNWGEDKTLAWRPYPRVVHYLMTGDPRMDEVTEEVARKWFPDAFAETT